MPADTRALPVLAVDSGVCVWTRLIDNVAEEVTELERSLCASDVIVPETVVAAPID